MSEPYSYRNPVLSLWQAAVADVHARRHSVKLRMATATVTAQRLETRPLAAADELMSPVHMVASGFPDQAHERNAWLPEGASALSLGRAVESVVLECAKTAAKFLVAEMKGDHEKAGVLAGELKFSKCDATGWSECVTSYYAFKASGGDRPYRADRNPVFDLDGKSRIAIIGDWGTGDEVAINLLQQVASLKPEVLIHLGDVYYAGTQQEQQSNFLDVCRQVLGSDIPLFSLCGNHDMYSGGNGYYWLVDHIGQQASYFCLRNKAWQFLAMDTGHNDNDPLTVGSNMTSLMTVDGWSEADWHLSKFREAGDRKTVFLSHHQLFSPFGSVGNVGPQPYAYNPALLANFQDVLPKVAWWFWGHEHTLAVYDPYMNLERGRCIGASAVPVFIDQQKYQKASGLKTDKDGPLPTWNPKGVLGDNGTDYAHGFAIMVLNGPSATVEYYQVPVLGTVSRLPVTDAV
jgi:Calcineurin-like phosphoesterase